MIGIILKRVVDNVFFILLGFVCVFKFNFILFFLLLVIGGSEIIVLVEFFIIVYSFVFLIRFKYL